METHPFEYYLPEKPKKLILGSFPCTKNGSYGDWFYSGSGRNHFWKLVSEIYSLPITTQKQKQNLCNSYGIAISDIAYKIQRNKSGCKDIDLDIIEYNTEALKICISSGIEKILFTSKFVETHFKKLFLKNSIPSDVLPSPSPQASIYIASLDEYKLLKNKGVIKDTYDYRLYRYRELLLK